MFTERRLSQRSHPSLCLGITPAVHISSTSHHSWRPRVRTTDSASSAPLTFHGPPPPPRWRPLPPAAWRTPVPPRVPQRPRATPTQLLSPQWGGILHGEEESVEREPEESTHDTSFGTVFPGAVWEGTNSPLPREYVQPSRNFSGGPSTPTTPS